MVRYVVNIIYNVRCTCHKWLPRINDSKGRFPDLTQCQKCETQWTPQDMINILGGKVEIKEFDSEILYEKMVKMYVDKYKYDVERANAIAIKSVEDQRIIFIKKYGLVV